MKDKILLKSVTVTDASSSFNGKTVDVLIQSGVISDIQSNIDSPDATIVANGVHVSGGWFDVFANCPSPGEPWKEDLTSLALAANAGGLTHVAALCGNHPLPETATAITQILEAGKNGATRILPLGLASEGSQGKEMAEVYEMNQAGSIGQTDGLKGSASVSLRSKLMQYCTSLNIPYIHFPFESKLVTGASVHEGPVAVNLGLKGFPVASETMPLLNDLVMAEWIGAPVNIMGISSAAAVDIVRTAKKNGLKIHASVPIMNLVYNDTALASFDENFKVYPPLRTEADRLALINGVLDGTIDAISSNHTPEDIETKKVEFDYATFGAATLPAFGAMLFAAFDKSQWPTVCATLATAGSKMYHQSANAIEIGEKANITVFDPSKSTKITSKNKATKAYNVIGEGQEFKGAVVGTICHGVWTSSNLGL